MHMFSFVFNIPGKHLFQFKTNYKGTVYTEMFLIYSEGLKIWFLARK